MPWSAFARAVVRSNRNPCEGIGSKPIFPVLEVEPYGWRLSPQAKSRAQRGPKTWRKRVRVERTRDGAKPPLAGFEDREDHRTPFASAMQPVVQSGASITPEPVLLVNSNPRQPSRQAPSRAGSPVMLDLLG